MKIAIKNGRVIDSANHLDKITDIAIDAGKILHVGPLPANFHPTKIIDAKNKWVLPGFIDVCCRPQMQHPHGSILHEEALAALKRGITSLCIPPDGEPIVDSSANALRLIQQGSLDLPHLYPMGALTTQLAGDAIADLTALANNGCIAFTNAQKPITDLRMLRYCYDYAASFDLLIVIQPQDAWLANSGIAHEGLMATRLGLPGIPETAETIAVAEHLLLIEQCNVRAHFTCLSSQHALQQIAHAKAQGLKVSADAAMHSLHLTEMDIATFDANCHLYPPLRRVSDRAALVQGFASGALDAICSDHRPLDSIAKLAPFGDTIPGLSAVDTFFSLGLHLVKEKQLALEHLIAAITSRPAEIFNIPGGTLSLGARADICIIDPDTYWVVQEEKLFSKGKNTPFKRWELPGIVTHTLVNGNLVHER